MVEPRPIGQVKKLPQYSHHSHNKEFHARYLTSLGMAITREPAFTDLLIVTSNQRNHSDPLFHLLLGTYQQALEKFEVALTAAIDLPTTDVESIIEVHSAIGEAISAVYCALNAIASYYPITHPETLLRWLKNS